MNHTQDVALNVIDIPSSFREHPMVSVDSLAQDIQKNGQLQEIVLTPKGDGRYELVAGKRRTLALRHLNWENARAQVMDNLSELQKALIMIAENDQRVDLNPFDRALSYQRAVNAGSSQKDLAANLGVAEITVSHTLGLLELSPEVTADCRRRQLSGAHLQELVRLPDAQSQLVMAETCNNAGWSSKVLRDKVSRALAGEGEKAAKAPAGPTGPFLIMRKGQCLTLRTKMPTMSMIDDAYIHDLRAAIVEFLAQEEPKAKEAAVANAA